MTEGEAVYYGAFDAEADNFHEEQVAEAMLLALGPRLEWEAREDTMDSLPGFAMEHALIYTDQHLLEYILKRNLANSQVSVQVK